VSSGTSGGKDVKVGNLSAAAATNYVRSSSSIGSIDSRTISTSSSSLSLLVELVSLSAGLYGGGDDGGSVGIRKPSRSLTSGGGRYDSGSEGGRIAGSRTAFTVSLRIRVGRSSKASGSSSFLRGAIGGIRLSLLN